MAIYCGMDMVLGSGYLEMLFIKKLLKMCCGKCRDSCANKQPLPGKIMILIKMWSRGLERWHSSTENWLLFQRTQVRFPESHGISQLSLTPVPDNLSPSSDQHEQ